MKSNYIDYNGNRVHWLEFGRGERLLIALHGFGDRARMFSVLDEALGERYTVMALDLPFHGQTEWQPDTFYKQDLVEIIRLLLESKHCERFTMMGFSFGARLVQAMLPDFINQLDKLYLLSPDGIRTRGMRMAVHMPMWVRKWLFKALRKPEWFLWLIRMLGKVRLLPPLIQHFLTVNLIRPDRFRRIFGCWLGLNSFYLRRRNIRALLRVSQLPTDVYFGTKDEMIRYRSVKKMADRLPAMRLFLLDQGHRLVGEQLSAQLTENATL